MANPPSAPAAKIRVAVFSAANQGEYEIMSISRGFQALQTLVGGNIEAIPHATLPPSSQPLVAYANEEGLARRMPRNWTAWGVLMQLGFRDTGVDGAFFGDVVVLGRGEKSLTDKDENAIKAAHARYLKEMDDD